MYITVYNPQWGPQEIRVFATLTETQRWADSRPRWIGDRFDVYEIAGMTPVDQTAWNQQKNFSQD
jgi:hypothetical protein